MDLSDVEAGRRIENTEDSSLHKLSDSVMPREKEEGERNQEVLVENTNTVKHDEVCDEHDVSVHIESMPNTEDEQRLESRRSMSVAWFTNCVDEDWDLLPIEVDHNFEEQTGGVLAETGEKVNLLVRFATSLLSVLMTFAGAPCWRSDFLVL